MCVLHALLQVSLFPSAIFEHFLLLQRSGFLPLVLRVFRGLWVLPGATLKTLHRHRLQPSYCEGR